MLPPTQPHLKTRVVIEVGIIAACLTWSCWPVFGYMAHKWAHDPRYSHGYLVPLFALGLLWVRRGRIARAPLQPSAWGLALLGFGALVHLAGGYIRSDWFDGLALLPYLTGLCVLVGGWPALAWAWPALGFLFFMVPLPWSLEVALGQSLQRLASISSAFVLQTLGYEAFAEGNVILIGDERINVAEACSGLSMLMTFFALTTAAALVLNRPWFERVLLVLSAIPIALMANISRIVLTGALLVGAGSKAAEHFYHDLAGWLMILFGLFLLWLETKFFHWAVVDEEEAEHVVLGLGQAPGLALPRGPGAV